MKIQAPASASGWVGAVAVADNAVDGIDQDIQFLVRRRLCVAQVLHLRAPLFVVFPLYLPQFLNGSVQFLNGSVQSLNGSVQSLNGSVQSLNGSKYRPADDDQVTD